MNRVVVRNFMLLTQSLNYSVSYAGESKGVNMKTYQYICLAVTSVLLQACAITDSNIPSYSQGLGNVTGQNGRACIRVTHIDSYGTLNDRVISIDASRNYYLATIHPGCPNIESSMGILLQGRFTEICGGRIDKIRTRDGFCSINKIYEFENQEQAFLAYDQTKLAIDESRKSVE